MFTSINEVIWEALNSQNLKDKELIGLIENEVRNWTCCFKEKNNSWLGGVKEVKISWVRKTSLKIPKLEERTWK